MYLFVICMMIRYWFQTKLRPYGILPKFRDFGAKMPFFTIQSTKNEIILYNIAPPPPVS